MTRQLVLAGRLLAFSGIASLLTACPAGGQASASSDGIVWRWEIKAPARVLWGDLQSNGDVIAITANPRQALVRSAATGSITTIPLGDARPLAGINVAGGMQILDSATSTLALLKDDGSVTKLRSIAVRGRIRSAHPLSATRWLITSLDNDSLFVVLLRIPAETTRPIVGETVLAFKNGSVKYPALSGRGDAFSLVRVKRCERSCHQDTQQHRTLNDDTSECFSACSETMELLQRSPRRWAHVPRLHRTANVSAIPQDGARAD